MLRDRHKRLQRLLSGQRCPACILETVGNQGNSLALISPLLIYFQSLEVRGGGRVIQSLQSSSTSVLHGSGVDNLNFSQLAVWEPIRHYLKRNSLCAAPVSGNPTSLEIFRIWFRPISNVPSWISVPVLFCLGPEHTADVYYECNTFMACIF